MEPDATNSLTNEQIARMFEWSGPLIADIGYPEWDRDVTLAIRDILPEIVRRGYQVVILFGDFGAHVQLLDPRRVVEAWECTDPPSIARVICEALARTEGQP